MDSKTVKRVGVWQEILAFGRGVFVAWRGFWSLHPKLGAFIEAVLTPVGMVVGLTIGIALGLVKESVLLLWRLIKEFWYVPLLMVGYLIFLSYSRGMLAIGVLEFLKKVF